MYSVLVFSRTKYGADKIRRKLEQAGIKTVALHSGRTQGQRQRALDGFKNGKYQVLVATDIAARGIDIDDVSHVINYELPKEPETYVHRIGRTARAGCDGDAISFCCAPERNYLRTIENLIRTTIPTDLEHTLHCDASMNASGADAKPAPRVQRGRGQRPARSNGSRKQSFGKRQRFGQRG